MKVTCTDGYDAYVAYGKTKAYGKYSVAIKGFPYWKYGAEACKVKLYAAPKGSMCNTPTKLNKNAKLKVKSNSQDEIVLIAKSLAFVPKSPYKKMREDVAPTRALL